MRLRTKLGLISPLHPCWAPSEFASSLHWSKHFFFQLDRDFANELIDLSTAHEHKLYIKTLEDIKKFLHSWESRDKEKDNLQSARERVIWHQWTGGRRRRGRTRRSLGGFRFLTFSFLSDFLSCIFPSHSKNDISTTKRRNFSTLHRFERVCSNDCVCEIQEKKMMI